MMPIGQPLLLLAPPDLYLVDDNLHQVDRVHGRVVSHNIYPVDVLAQTARQGLAISTAIDRAMAVAFPPPRRRMVANDPAAPIALECTHWSRCSRFERTGSCG